MSRRFPQVDLEPLDDSFKAALIGNPIYAEFGRQMRKFWTGGTGAINAGLTIVAGLIYLTILGITITFRQNMEPAIIWGTMLVFLIIAIPAVSHGAIAGEREKRTWDSLLTAPLSNKEIVIGKYFSGLGVAGVIVLLFVPVGPITFFNPNVRVESVLGGFLVVVGYGIFLQALTIFISSRCSRSHAAQIATLGAQFVLLALWPILTGVFFQGNAEGQAATNFFNPFMHLAGTLGAYHGYGVPQFLVYFVAAVILMMVTTARLLTQDGAVRSSRFAPAPKPSEPEQGSPHA